MRRENLPLKAHYVLKHRPKLFSAAVRDFRIPEQRACRRWHYKETLS